MEVLSPLSFLLAVIVAVLIGGFLSKPFPMFAPGGKIPAGKLKDILEPSAEHEKVRARRQFGRKSS